MPGLTPSKNLKLLRTDLINYRLQVGAAAARAPALDHRFLCRLFRITRGAVLLDPVRVWQDLQRALQLQVIGRWAPLAALCTAAPMHACLVPPPDSQYCYCLLVVEVYSSSSCKRMS